MKRKLFAAFMAAAVMGSIIGCSSQGMKATQAPQAVSAEQGEPTSGEDVGKEGYRFAFAVKNRTNPFFINMIEGMEAECEKLGATLNVQAAESEKDIDKQIQTIQAFLSQDYDAIFITPLSAVAVVPVIKECNDAGVPVILIDTRADATEMEKIGAKMDYFVTGDNKNAGELAAQAMVDVLSGEGDIAILESTAGSSAGIAVLEGMHEVLAKSSIQIVASQTADNNRNKGYEVAQGILAANPNIDGILACNDEMGLGAINALKDGGFENIPVIGINNAPDAQTALKDGTMYATVDKCSDEQGATAIRRAMEMLEGKAIPPEEMLECTVVKVENLQ